MLRNAWYAVAVSDEVTKQPKRMNFHGDERILRLNRLGIHVIARDHAILLRLINRAVIDVIGKGYGAPRRFVVSSVWFRSRFRKAAPSVPAEFDPNTETVYLNADYPWSKLARIQVRQYRSGHLSTSHLLHILRHEIGHALHVQQQPQLVKRLQRASFRSNWRRRNSMRISRTVSRYAAVNPLEFVAEVFAGVSDGRRFPQDVLELYRKFRGPVPTSPIASARAGRA